MKLTLFLVVLSFCYCVSYEAIDVGPGSLELASMTDQNYGDLGAMQLERHYVFDPSSNSILDMRKRMTKSQSKLCSEKTGGCFIILDRGLRSDPKLVIAPPLMPNEILYSKRHEEVKSFCKEEEGGCPLPYLRHLRSGPKQNPRKSGHTKSPRTMENAPCEEKFGACSYTSTIRLHSGNPFSTVVKKNMDSPPDYVNLDDEYSDHDYQS